MAHAFGEVVLVPFPFTDQSGAKKRPAVIVSSNHYNASRRDLIIMAITSQVRQPLAFGALPKRSGWRVWLVVAMMMRSRRLAL